VLPILNNERQRVQGPAGPLALKKHSQVRPYTQFSAGGLYRFRSADPAFRPFRIG
jgi:hypothetical protein